MVKVKVSTPWSHIDFNTRIASDNNTGYKFYFDQSEKEFDFWIVWGGIKTEKETVICPKKNVIYLTDEVHVERLFSRLFLDQFQTIVTCRRDLNHPVVINTHELNTWLIQKDYDWLYDNEYIPKSKMLSVVSSNQTWLPGHKLRFDFVKKLKEHFKDKIDLFGKGINPVEDKFDALAPYKYSVAIENSSIPGYFTEKITDCYLTHTMPIYYGCPDIENYFDRKSMLLIDPRQFQDAVLSIEQLIEEDKYDDILPILKTQKIKYLEEYHIFNKLIKMLEAEFSVGSKKEKVTIKAEQCFHRGYKINRIIKSSFGKMPIPFIRHFQFRFSQDDLYANKKIPGKEYIQ